MIHKTANVSSIKPQFDGTSRLFMKNTIRTLFISIIATLLIFLTPAWAKMSEPTYVKNPYSITINAKSWILINQKTGQIITSHQMHQQHAPASLTKIMTAYLVAQYLKNGDLTLDTKIPVSQHSSSKRGSRMFIETGARISVKNLLHGMIIQSGNDAATALAEYIGGTEKSFVHLMNDTAEKLGMNETHFATPDGLPSDTEQYTTAYDMAILSRAFIKQFPDIFKIYSKNQFTWNDIKQLNRNVILKEFDGADGMKTGYTKAAGYNLIATAKRNKTRYTAVVLGAPSPAARALDASRLLRVAFTHYTNKVFYQKGDTFSISADKIQNAKNLDATLEVFHPYTVTQTLRKSLVDELVYKLTLKKGIHAPITENQPVGHLVVQTDQDKTLAKIALYAQNSIQRASLWQRLFR